MIASRGGDDGIVILVTGISSGCARLVCTGLVDLAFATALISIHIAVAPLPSSAGDMKMVGQRVMYSDEVHEGFLAYGDATSHRKQLEGVRQDFHDLDPLETATDRLGGKRP